VSLETFKISFKAPNIIVENREPAIFTMRAMQRAFVVIKSIWGIIQTSNVLIEDVRIGVDRSIYACI